MRFDAISDRTFLGEVTEVGIVPTAFATTFPVTLRLTTRIADVRPGMAAEVDFDFGDAGEQGLRFLVPSVAVGEDRGRTTRLCR